MVVADIIHTNVFWLTIVPWWRPASTAGACFQCSQWPFLTFVPHKAHNNHNGLDLCRQFLGHSKRSMYWSHYRQHGASVTCDMNQVGFSVSGRTPTRRIQTARRSRAYWRPTSRACGPSSSTVPPTSLPSSTRWLGERLTTREHALSIKLFLLCSPIVPGMN